MTYAVDLPGLADLVAKIQPDSKHKALLAALQRYAGADLAGAQVVAVRGDIYLQRRHVLTAAGQLVAPDHEAWLQEQCDAAVPAALAPRLRALDYRLSQCNLTRLYVTVDRASARAQDFLQLEIDLEEERIDRRLFDEDASWRRVENLRDLCSAAEDGPRVAEVERTLCRPVAYRLRRAVDVAQFVEEAERIYIANNEKAGARLVKVTPDGGEPRVGTVAELFPESKPGPWKGRRLFEDWAVSSAGRAGERFCHHWALDLQDWTNPRDQHRDMALIPVWGFAGKLAKVGPLSLSDYALFGKLETLDRRTKCPFAWYFYMLHGNRVEDWVGHRIIRAAEAGAIVLAEHDYRVLKGWEARIYGF